MKLLCVIMVFMIIFFLILIVYIYFILIKSENVRKNDYSINNYRKENISLFSTFKQWFHHPRTNFRKDRDKKSRSLLLLLSSLSLTNENHEEQERMVNHDYSMNNIIERIISEPTNITLFKERRNRINRLHELLMLYQYQHSRTSIINHPTSICHRKFVSVRFICHHAGNSVVEFLSEFVWAFIYNRTILVDFKSTDCYDAIELSNWIVLQSDQEIKNLAKNASCPLLDPHIKSSELVQMRGEPIYCCNFQDVSFQTIHFGGPKGIILGLRDEESTSHPNMITIRNRSDTIFQASYDTESFLGYIATFLLNISNNILSLVNPVLDDIYTDKLYRKYKPNQFVIGLHLRHQSIGNEYDYDRNAEICLQKLRSHIPDGYSCIILLASDRLPTYHNITSFAPSINCTLRYVARSMSMTYSWGNHSTNGDIFSEQGPWQNSVTSMADYYLLSHSQLFVGTMISTFSQLIASWASANSIRRGSVSNNFITILNNPQDVCILNPIHMKRKTCSSKSYVYNEKKRKCVFN